MSMKMVFPLTVLAFAMQHYAHAASYTYVGSYHVGEGPAWTTNPTVYSGREAAALLFGGNPQDYVISTVSANPDDINYKAYLDGWADDQYLNTPQDQDWKLDDGAPGYDDPAGFGTAYSAYVLDHSCSERYTDPGAACTDSYINYVFRIMRSGMAMTFMPLLLEKSARNRLDTLYQRRENVTGSGSSGIAQVADRVRLAAADSVRSDAGDMPGVAAMDAGHGMFFEARHADFEHSADAAGNGLDGSGWQYTAGYDRRFTDRFMAGMALGYDKLDGKSLLAGNNGNGDIYSVSIYGRYLLGGWYADAVLGYAHGDFSTRNNMARGDTNSSQVNAEVRIGTHHDIVHKARVSPYAGLRYVYNTIDGYTESGVGGNTYADHDSEAVYALFGTRLEFAILAGQGWTVRPSLDATFSKRLSGGNDDLNYLDPSSTPYSVPTLDFDKHGVSIGGRMELQRGHAYSVVLGAGVAHGSEGTDKSAYINLNIPL